MFARYFFCGSVALTLIFLLSGGFVFWKILKIKGYKQSNIFDSFLALIFFGLILGKLFYVAFAWSKCCGSSLAGCLVSRDFSLIGLTLGVLVTAYFLAKIWRWDIFVLFAFLFSGTALAFGGRQDLWLGVFDLSLYAVLLVVGLIIRSLSRIPSGFFYLLAVLLYFGWQLARGLITAGQSFRLAFLTPDQWWCCLMLGYVTLNLLRLFMPKSKNAVSENFLQKIEKDLSKEEKDLSSQIQKLSENDPYLATDRADDNAEPADDVMEDLGHDDTTISLSILQRTLRRIRTALKRIKRGRYGKCERCGQPITQSRLTAIPTTKICSGCAEKEQNEQAVESDSIDPKNLREIRRVS